MSDKYEVGAVVGHLRIIERPATNNGKFLVECTECGSVGDKHATSVYKTGKHGTRHCKTCRDISYRRNDEIPAVRRAMISTKTNALSRGYGFYMSLDEYYEVVKKDCYFCGKEPGFKRAPKDWQPDAQINGIDRMDNTLGYSVENCVASCYDCNRSKSDLTVEEFKEWCERIYTKTWWKEE